MKKIKCFKSKKKSWIKGDSCLSNPTSHKYRSQTNFESGNNLVRKSEFVVEKLVTAIKEHFPKLGADTCFDFNKHSELVYKIINNLDLDPGTDKKLPFINLLMNYDEYKDDPQICAAVEADGEANQILICMKVISTIVEKFKNNTEVIGLNLEIVKVVVSKYATHLPLDVMLAS
ncbi:hypothetical protein RF11_14608 [Thelohanellus kitauei]|uniref:Uncharacterized protein n=1 Tax=Thelohanellus kitauei TaxID=669202 RepID=A0A0C2N455_THEKT|nr:hypothetical protein RF11_14608 [Thelohanellus kitauei]